MKKEKVAGELKTKNKGKRKEQWGKRKKIKKKVNASKIDMKKVIVKLGVKKERKKPERKKEKEKKWKNENVDKESQGWIIKKVEIRTEKKKKI